MSDTLVSALERLHVDTSALEDDWIDNVLDEQRPQKRVKQNPVDLKHELERKYLTPATSFSTEWLNRLQQ
jgi:antiviral helicase SKI2